MTLVDISVHLMLVPAICPRFEPYLCCTSEFDVLDRFHALRRSSTSNFPFQSSCDSNMTRFRPCIDLHAGQVKQIVGGTLSTQTADLKTNHVSGLPASHFADLYKNDGLTGAHVIMLGPGNEEAARDALSAWPNGLQVGGGVTEGNALQWIENGAEKVTS